MSWTLLGALLLGHVLALLALRHRRTELQRTQSGVHELRQAQESGSHRARLQYPHVDLSRCIGCESCVKACPEDGVLQLIHGQAVVVHGARCVGHGRCADVCPVGAIALTLADIAERRDIPVLTEEWESTRLPGLFLAGEVTGFALIRTAIEHGRTIADAVARRVTESGIQRSPHASPAPAPAFARAAAGADGHSAGPAAGRSTVAAAGFSDGHSATALAPSPSATTAVATAPPNQPSADAGDILDLCIVGAGPAGLACSLQAKAHGLRFVTLEQEQLGGTVANYPRRKLVMTQPVELPLHGRLTQGTYSKEELMQLWHDVAEQHRLPILTNVVLQGVEPADGHLVVRTSAGVQRARHVCLALGRRGTPRKLGVPGEELAKVSYSLLDAQSYTGRRVLVVGGGDSAVEAALGLADQPGNVVTISYRQEAFTRLKARNDTRLREALAAGRLNVAFGTQVTRITPDAVHLVRRAGAGGAGGADAAGGAGGGHASAGANGSGSAPTAPELQLANDEIFVMAGGIPPFELLERSGISFDPAERPAAAPLAEQGTGLGRALAISFALALATVAWIAIFADYYLLPPDQRFGTRWHDVLRPSGAVGLAAGVVAATLVVVNLAYLLRRSRWGQRLPGSLKGWMTSHVVTGILATLLVVVHSAMAPHNSIGGQAFAALAVLVVTGTIGRYLYSFVPRAANGRELQLDEVKARLAALSSEWDRDGRGLADSVRAEVDALVDARQWNRSFPQRLRALLAGQGSLRRTIARLTAEARARDVPDSQVARLVELSRTAHRTSLMAAHYEDLRALLSSWRFLHRWVALLMVLLLAWHIVTALRFGELLR